MKKIILLALFVISAFAMFAQEDVSFTSDGLTLNGTFSTPADDGPSPVVILVHGSGPSDRNQRVSLNDGNSACIYPGLFNNTIANFQDIAEHLNANGVAVLRYDKRSFTHGAILDPLTVSTKDFVTDIENAIRYVSTRPEVDTSCIILAGHSQGATLIPIAALNTGMVNGLISLAGPVTPVDSLLPEQYRAIYAQCARDATSGALVANQFYEQFELIRARAFPANTQILINFPGNPTNPVPFGYERFWRDWIDMGDSVLENYKIANLPTLIIQGKDDFNVPYEDALRFQAALPTGNTTVELYHDINHFLTPAYTPNVAPAILDKLVDWIGNIKRTTSVQEPSSLDKIQIRQMDGRLDIQFPNTTHSFHRLVLSDVQGKVLADAPMIGRSECQLEATSGILLLSFFSEQGVATKKIWIY